MVAQGSDYKTMRYYTMRTTRTMTMSCYLSGTKYIAVSVKLYLHILVDFSWCIAIKLHVVIIPKYVIVTIRYFCSMFK